MGARIIDGKAIAADLRAKVAAAVRRLGAEHGLIPGLAVALVGEDPASAAYVRSKSRHTVAAGMRSFDHQLPAGVSQRELPALIDAKAVIAAIDPEKDVDGFHPLNAGRLATGLPALVPCTPLGCILLTRTVLPSLAGCEAVVVGRSNIVGRPLAQLLVAENATVTIAHSRTRQIPAVCRRADLLDVAAGRAEMVRGDWIKPGAIVIDVGQNRIAGAHGKPRLVGDVAFAEACEVAGAITPVPGGVGPMTIACLLANTVRAACALAGLAAPNLGNVS